MRHQQVYRGPDNLLALQIEHFGSKLPQASVEHVVDSGAVKTTGLNRIPHSA